MKVRKQSGCVVFREKGGKIQVLLITSSNKGIWTFPKGGVEHDLSKKASAAKEVLEEAGVLGKIIGRLGEFNYKKRGRQQRVVMYAMRYTKKAKEWDEEGERIRKWVDIDKARKILKAELRPFMDRLQQMLDDDDIIQQGKIQALSKTYTVAGNENFKVDDSVGANTNNREFENVVRHLEEMQLLKELALIQPVLISVADKAVKIASLDLNIRIIVSKANVHAKMLVVQYAYEGVSHTERVGLTKVNAVLNRVINQYFAHQRGTEGIGLGF